MQQAHDYSGPAAEFIKTQGPSLGIPNADKRLMLVKGNSQDTVPAFAVEHPETKCDILSVDGLHTFTGADSDIENMKNLANGKCSARPFVSASPISR